MSCVAARSRSWSEPWVVGVHYVIDLTPEMRRHDASPCPDLLKNRVARCALWRYSNHTGLKRLGGIGITMQQRKRPLGEDDIRSGAGDPWQQGMYAPPEDDEALKRSFGGGHNATLGKRFMGALIDGLLMVIAIIFGLFAFDIPLNQAEGSAEAYVGLLLLSLLQMFLITTRGQTLGKMAMGTRIVLMDGGEVGFLHGVVLRAWVLSAVSFIPLIGALVGLADPLFIFGEERRCIHDQIAGTRVIELP